MVTLQLTGCSSRKLGKGVTDRDIYELAEKQIKDEDFDDGIIDLKALIDRFPSSPYLEHAYFDLGRAYFLNEENINAQVAFDDFMRLYPESKLVPRAILLKGKVIERDLVKPGRDQTAANNALDIYSRLVAKYPGTKEAREGENRYESLREHLANNEIVVGKFYLRMKKYTSAKMRLERSFSKYGDTGAAPEIALLLGETYASMGNMAGATRILDFLKTRYPDREETRNLTKRIKRAKR